MHFKPFISKLLDKIKSKFRLHFQYYYWIRSLKFPVIIVPELKNGLLDITKGHSTVSLESSLSTSNEFPGAKSSDLGRSVTPFVLLWLYTMVKTDLSHLMREVRTPNLLVLLVASLLICDLSKQPTFCSSHTPKSRSLILGLICVLTHDWCY